MEAENLLKEGDLDGAVASLQADIRADASNSKLRIFLFQLLCVRGEWKRAIAQLKVSAEMDPKALAMAQTYREGIVCEVYREKVFSGEKEPLIFGKPEEWIALMVEAIKANAAGRHDHAAEIRAKAFEAAPVVSGKLNGKAFEWIADAQAEFEEPVDLRDAVWTPANIKLANGGDIVALLPTRYAGTIEKGGPAEKLARSTNWIDLGTATFFGIGQRLYTTDIEETALMDIRSLEMNIPASSYSGADES